MERILKFRGKRFDNGEWVVGSLLSIEDTCFIIEGGDFDFDYRTEAHAFWFDCTEKEVDPDTVSQFTGLYDKSGKEIYEGDILRSPLGNIVVVKFGYKEHIVKHDIFTDSFAAYGWIVENVKNGITDFLDNEFLQGEVIGNIHDNPSLISDKR